MSMPQGAVRDALPSQGTDDQIVSLLDVVCTDPLHADDRRRVIEAILECARRNGGTVDPNHVRELLTDERGDLRVFPKVVGPTYAALARQGRIRRVGWVVSTDTRGRNSGKPCRTYELTSWDGTR